MKVSLESFEGIGQEYAQKLKKKLRIHSVDDFLNYSLEELHAKTQIDMERLKQWADVLDLFQIPNITPREAELLYFANINSVSELSHRQAVRIFYKLKEIDEDTYYIILQIPKFAEIEKWIFYAKLMTKRIKYGENVPIILCPMVNIDNASELKNFRIFTIEDFVQKYPLISNLRQKINMKRRAFKDLLNMIQFIQIGGIDIYFAKILFLANIRRVDDLRSKDIDTILDAVTIIQSHEEEVLEKITREHILQILQNLEGK